MKTMKTCLLTLTALLSLGFAKAQTADEIIAKHTEALGGKDKLSQVTAVYIESGTEVMGNESASKVTVLNGKGFRSEADFNGQQLIQVVTDQGGWAINPFGGATSPSAMPQEQYNMNQDQIYFPDPLVNYAAHGAKVELQGKEKVGAVEAYKLKYTNKNNGETIFYIDPSTWQIVQSVKQGNAMGQEITITSGYSDYRKTDFGVYVPYVTDVDMGQFALKVNVKKVEINQAVSPTIFEMKK